MINQPTGSGHLHRLSCLLAVVQSLTSTAWADEVQQDSNHFLHVSAAYAYLPSADFQSAGSGSAVKAKETQLAMGFFQSRAGEFRFDAGLDYQYNHYAYTGIESRNRDLHRLQFPVGFNRRSDDWSLAGFVAPGVATSSNVFKDLFDRGSSDDFVVSARLEAVVPRTPRFAWLGGIAYDRSFGGDKAYPLLGLIYRPGEKFGLRLAFPESSILYNLTGRQRLSLSLFPAGYAWHVVSDTLNDEFDYEWEAIRLQGAWSYRVSRSFALDLCVGYEFDRQLSFVDDTGQSIDSAVDDQFLVMLGIRWGNGPVPWTNRVTRLDRFAAGGAGMPR